MRDSSPPRLPMRRAPMAEMQSTHVALFEQRQLEGESAANVNTSVAALEDELREMVTRHARLEQRLLEQKTIPQSINLLRT